MYHFVKLQHEPPGADFAYVFQMTTYETLHSRFCTAFICKQPLLFFHRDVGFCFLLTGSRANSVHGSHGSPLVPLWVVALTGAEPIGPIEPSHGVKQAVDDCHTHTYTPCQHRGYQMPLVPFWIIPAEKKQHKSIFF